MRAWLLALSIAMSASPAKAEADLLQQLYGKSSRTTPAADAAPKTVPSPSAPSPVELRLLESATIQKERIYAQDIVTCTGGEDICQQIFVVELGLAPKPGRQDKWAREKIENLLAGEFPGQAFHWSGASVVTVSAVAVPVQEEEVRKLLDKLLSKINGQVRLKVQNMRLPSLTQLRHANYDFSLPNFETEIAGVVQNPRRRYAQFKLHARDAHLDAPANYEMLIAVTFIAEVQAVVSKSNLQRSQSIGEDDVEEKWIAFQEQVFSKKSEAIGKLVRTRLVAGQPVRMWDLTSEPAVHRGEKIEAIVSGNGVKLNGVAEALESGAIGQKIRVRLEATKRNVVGTVVARSQVEVPMR